jgi:hypothetical protein
MTGRHEVRLRRYIPILAAVSVVIAISACSGDPSSMHGGTPVSLKFKSARAVTISANSPADVQISANDPSATIKESGALPKGMSLRGYSGGRAAIAGIPQGGSGGRYTLHLMASDRSRQTVQTFILTVDDKPAFSPFNSSTIVATYPGSAQTPILVTGYPKPVLTITALGGQSPTAIAFHPYTDGGALITVAPGWLESPCSNKLTLTATNSAGVATDTITVSFVNLRCLPNAVLDFFIKNAVSIGKNIYKGGKFIGQWIVKGGKAVGKLVYKDGKAAGATALPAAEDIPEEG